MIGLLFLARLDIWINPTNTKYIKGRMLDYFRKQTLKGIVEEHIFTIKIYETKEECFHEQNLQGEKTAWQYLQRQQILQLSNGIESVFFKYFKDTIRYWKYSEWTKDYQNV